MKKFFIALIGMTLTMSSASATDRYVALNGTHVSPFTNWAMAATGIQYAISACSSGDVVWVTNGTYEVGSAISDYAGRIETNRIAITNAITVRSVSGAPYTIIKGGLGIRGVFMGSNSTLYGFTVKDANLAGVFDFNGAGIEAPYGNWTLSSPPWNPGDWLPTNVNANAKVYNCIIRDNLNGYNGGGAHGLAVFYNCLFVSNSSVFAGGAVCQGVFYNCTAVNNSSGIRYGYSYNCIMWDNSGNDYPQAYLTTNSCSPGLSGNNNITNDPLFVSSSDFHLQSNSPCINAGTNMTWMTNSFDLDGNPRIINVIVDMGAYEYGAPVIIVNPTSQTCNAGQSITFSVMAGGEGPLFYQWQKNGTNIGSATSTNYTIASAQESDEGNYRCMVTNTIGSTASSAATLSINDPPAISGNPQSQTNNPGSSATFSITATGTAPLIYQWQKDTVNIGGATSENYTIASVAETNEGNYRCIVTNMAGAATSVVASLTVNDPPAISGNPQSRTNNPGSLATFSLTATGTAPLIYQWQKDAVNIGSATSENYTIASVAETNEGNYRCIVTNMAGAATSAVASLTVNNPPVITSDPQSQTNNPGASANFSVTATGTAPLIYQWQKDTVNIGGATSENYTIASVAETNEGNYRCIITNMAGSATSTVASLTVNDPPATPDGVNASDGTYPAKVLVTWNAASGASGYQLFRYTSNDATNANQIGTTTSTTYDDTNAVADMTYYYWVKSTNAAGISDFSAYDTGYWISFTSTPNHYVSLDGAHIFPYTNWATAATGIQYAVSACSSGDVVWVTNGTYEVGSAISDYAGRIETNRIAITNAITVRSASGASSTIIKGGDRIRGVFMGSNSTLYGFTVKDANLAGVSDFNGAGIEAPYGNWTLSSPPWNPGDWLPTNVNVNAKVYNCIIRDNLNGYNGGGAHGLAVFYNCLFVSNSSVFAGGAVCQGVFYNCVAVSNSSGIRYGYTYNSIMWNNSGNDYPQAYLTTNSCSAGLSGNNNITNDPLFVSSSDFHLQSISACINAGTNMAWMTGSFDLSGNPRINGIVDMGAYEYGGPYITVNPVSQTHNAGQTVTFSAMASGEGSLYYQWQKNGTNISGATATNYTIASAQETDEGSYRCVVTNTVGSNTSSAATLNINDSPAITSNPQSRTNNPGSSATFSLTATGTAPLIYQWQKDSVNIGGATSVNYTIASVVETNEGNYRCIVTNMAGAATSAVASLTVNNPPVITSDPQSRTNNPGSSATFSVTATGTAPLIYQWQKDTVNIGGATSANYTIASVAETNEGNYRCIATNMAGSATSLVARLTVNDPPATPEGMSASDGDYTNKVALIWNAASGASGYQIFRYTSNNSASANLIGTATATTYDDTSAVAGTIYYYWVKATNAAGVSGFSASNSGWRRAVYTITATAGANGNIIPSGAVMVLQGANQSFTILPLAGYYISSLLVDGVAVSAASTYTFENVSANHSIAATFGANQSPQLVLVTTPQSGVAPLQVLFNFSGSTDPDGTIVKYEVDRSGDGIFEVQSTESGVFYVEFSAAGTYQAVARVTDDCNATSTKTVTIQVNGMSPTAVIEAQPGSGTAPLTVNFTGENSTAPAGRQIVAYEWDFEGDGVYDRLTLNGNASWTYREAGTNLVTLRVTDDAGMKAESSTLVVVLPSSFPPPIVTLSANPEAGYLPMTVAFTAQLAQGQVCTNYQWDFDGDGQYDARTAVGFCSNTYTVAGMYAARVMAMDTNGLTGIGVVMVQVNQATTLRAWISTPKDNSRVSGTEVSLRAHAAPANLAASAQFQYKLAASNDWINLGSAIYPPPYSYAMTWDVTGLPRTSYHLRVAVTDTDGAIVYSDTIRVTVAVSSHLMASSQSQPGDIDEGSEDGKHKKSETFSRDSSAILIVYDGTMMLAGLGTVDANITINVILTGLNTNPVNGAAFGRTCINENREVSIEGNPELQKTVVIIIPYRDEDNDGVVDGTRVKVSTLMIFWYDTETGAWKRCLETEVHPDEKYVKGKTYHLAEFGLFGSVRESPIYGDFDGDRKSDLAIYQMATGIWRVLLSGSGYQETQITLGGPGARAVPADYDADQKTDPAVYRDQNGYWFGYLSSRGYLYRDDTYLGGPGCLFVPSDYDGDGKADPAVYQESTGMWAVQLSGSSYQTVTASFGGTGYSAIQGDYDGDGKTDPAVYHESSGLWNVMCSGSGYVPVTVGFGGPGYYPVPADYDGDSRIDPAVYNASSGQWVIMLSNSGYTQASLLMGGPGYYPVPGDYDAAGRISPAVYLESTGEWQVLLSGSGYAPATTRFGGQDFMPANICR